MTSDKSTTFATAVQGRVEPWVRITDNP